MSESQSAEIVKRGEELYARVIRDKVESQHKGRFLALDVDSGEYAIDDEMLTALDRARAEIPGAVLYVVRIGYASAVKLGSQLRTVEQ